MKRNIFLVLLVVLFANVGFSQKPIQNNNSNDRLNGETVVIHCSDFHVTKPLIEIAAEHPIVEDRNLPFFEYPDQDGRPVQTFMYSVENDGVAYGNDPNIVQNELGMKASSSTIQNWAGQTTNTCRPFDPSGAVGPNHYIQMINSTTYKIWNKAGTVLASGTFGDLWNPHTGNEGDPIVLYDKTADRWFMSQFGTQSDNKIYIAISQTNDPTGAWYAYTFTAPEFTDYLKFSAWQDAYYMTANSVYKIFAFNRTKMLAGDASAELVYSDFTPNHPVGFFVPLPADASDGVMPGAGTPCPIFTYSDDAWGGGATDAVHIYNASVTWGSSPVMSITDGGTFSTNAFDASYDADWEDISQPGTTTKLDGIGGALMFRAQWKTWTNHSSVVLSWAVKVSSTQRGIFWCEMRQDKSSSNWSIYQQGIYAPGTDSYWLSSIAMNNAGDIALCYAKASSSTYMSLAYTGRHASDPLGTMTISETIAKAGTGAQTGVVRVGDYAQTCLDPDGVTFWHTGEYMGNSGNAGTQVYSFQLPASCTPPTTQASNFSTSNIGDNQITVSWNRGNGDKVIVVARKSYDANQTPNSGTAYTANTAFGSGSGLGADNYVVYNGTGTSVTITGLTSGTAYAISVYEYFTADNCYNTNGLTGTATTTGTSPCSVCAAGATSDDDETGITKVVFNTINNSSAGDPGYTDFSSKVTSVNLNSSYNLTVNVNTAGDYDVYAKAWIDWNHDCDFNDAGEEYDLGSVTDVTDGATSNSPLSIIVPSDATVGNTTMRIRAIYDDAPLACGDQDYSEAEDYTIHIVDPNNVSSVNNNFISVYPNPSNGEFFVTLNNNSNYEVNIYNIAGKMIYFNHLNKNTNKINIGQQTPGVYFMKIYNDEVSKTIKLIIK